MELTLENLINELGKDGCGSKKTVLKMLENATIEDLWNLKYSVQKKINLKMLEESREK